MKRRGVSALLLALALVMGLVLVGCGGAGGASADAKAAFVGTWDLSEMEEDGEVTDADDIAMLRALGLDVYLELDDDGSAHLLLFGDSTDGTWTANSATEATFTIDGDNTTMTLADGKLSMENDGAKLVFVKGEARTATEEEAAPEPVMFDQPVTIADDDTCTIVATGKADYYGDPAILLNIANKTDKPLYVTTTSDDFTVGDVQLSGILSASVDPGETEEDAKLWFDSSELGDSSIDALTDVSGTIDVSDGDTYETINTYDVAINAA